MDATLPGNAHSRGDTPAPGIFQGPEDGAARRQAPPQTRTPPAVKFTIFAVLGTLLLGTLYLIAVRGQALILDLSKLGQVLCF